MISVGASSPEEALADHQGGKHEMESKPFYELKAALTAMWLPAVVGDKRNMFIAASLSTLITKILMLLLSVILVYFFQEKVHSHPFVLWSKVGKSPNLLLANQAPILLLFKSIRQIWLPIPNVTFRIIFLDHIFFFKQEFEFLKDWCHISFF